MAQSALHTCHTAAPEVSPEPIKEKKINKIKHAKVN